MVRPGVRLVGWGTSNPFVAIAGELGITLDKDNSDSFKGENHRFQRNGEPLNEDQRAACLGFYSDSFQAISAAAKQGQDVIVSDMVDMDNEFTAPFLCGVTSVWGQDIDLVSSADFDNATGELGFQALHGYGNLVAAWGADVAVSLNTRAEQVDWSGHGVTVDTPKGASAARAALCTVSTGILASGEIFFTPGLPDWKTAAINGLPMGTENKMGVYFDTDVFGAKGRGHYSIWNDDGNAAKIDAGVMGLNTAAVFVGGRHGIWLEKQGQQACHDFAVDRIADIFGHDIRKHVNRSIVTAWGTEPGIVGLCAARASTAARQSATPCR
jgi:monoamine oxidase